MTEDYAIQQQRPSATPYVAVGAGAGAGLGYLVNNKWAAKPMSHDDIVSEMNDKDKFEANTKDGAENKASWEDVQAKQKAFEDAKTELAEAEKGKVNPQLEKDYENAKQEYETAFNKFKNQKANELSGKTSTSVAREAITVDNLPEFSELTIKKLPDGKPKDLENQYKDLKKAITDARTNVESNSKSLVEKRDVLTKAIGELAQVPDGVKGEDNISNYFTNKIAISETGAKSETSLYKDVKRAVADAMGEAPTKLTDEEFIKNAEIAPKGRQVSGYRYSTIQVMKDGKYEKIIYRMPTNDYATLLESTKIAFEAEKQAATDEIFSNLGKIYEENQKLKNLDATLNQRILNETIEATELFNKATKANPNPTLNWQELQKLDVNNLKSQLKNAQKAETPNTQNIKKLTAQIEVLEKFNAEKSMIESNIRTLTESNGIVSNLQGQIDSALTENEAYQKAVREFKEKFPNVLSETETKVEIPADIDKKAAVYAEEQTKTLKEAMDKAKAAMENGKGGEVDAKALEEAKTKVRNTEDAFKESTKNLAEKLGKKPLMNKWLAMGIGAVALTLGALAIRPKAKTEV